MCNVWRTALSLGFGACLSIGGCGRSDTLNERTGNAQPVADFPPDAATRAPSGVHRVSGSPVTATLTIAPDRVAPGKEVALNVTLEIEPLWEVRALGDRAASTATRLELELPDGIAAENDWKPPKSTRSISPDGHSVYADQAVFTRQLRVTPDASAGEVPIKCLLHYQACNDRQCLEPAAVELAATLNVE